MEERRRGSGWIGWVIFLLFFLGPSILPPLSRWLSQLTGQPIGTSDLFILLIVSVIVFSIGSRIFAVLRNVSERTNRSELPEMKDLSRDSSTPGERYPMPIPPPEEIFRTPPPPPEPPRLPASSTQLPSPPRFEPIIDPRILAFGILGLIFIGLGCGVLFLILKP
ncbi:MAG: hypothetical protein K6356_04595 [Chloroflexus sp.]